MLCLCWTQPWGCRGSQGGAAPREDSSHVMQVQDPLSAPVGFAFLPRRCFSFYFVAVMSLYPILFCILFSFLDRCQSFPYYTFLLKNKECVGVCVTDWSALGDGKLKTGIWRLFILPSPRGLFRCYSSYFSQGLAYPEESGCSLWIRITL